MNFKRVLVVLVCSILTLWVSYNISTYNAAYVQIPVSFGFAHDSDALIGFSCDIMDAKGIIHIPVDGEGQIINQSKEVPFTVINNSYETVTITINLIMDTDENCISMGENTFNLSAGEQKETTLLLEPIKKANFLIELIIRTEGYNISSTIERKLRFEEKISE